jgi:23S rRNA (pseudouridine1915-N3)-methyltransferase
MRIRLVTVSHRQPGWVLDACADYVRRLPREWGFEVVEIKPEHRGSGSSTERVQAAEAERLRRAVPKGARLVVLDERGKALTSTALSERVRRWQQEGRDVAILVGGADGLDPALRDAADECLQLSAMTLPHGLVRIVTIEQLYRASTLLAGHPYHK